MKVQLFIVDPQKDFCVADDGHGNKGTLVVPGAEQDMSRVATMLRRIGTRVDDIHVTLDSHQTVGIERPRWWKRLSDGAPPDPFSCLGIHPDGKRIVKFIPAPAGSSVPANMFGMIPTEEEYTTYIPSYLHKGGPTGKGSFGYLQALAAKGRYPHIVWTLHCRVGSWGHGVVDDLYGELCRWENDNFAKVDYVVKGNNPFTEHFSGVKAEVEDPNDPGTRLNKRLIQALEDADVIAVTGEALSHCVANTFRDVADGFSDPKYISKLVLLTDACSNVGEFDFLGDAFIRDMTAKGMRIDTTTSFLA